MRASGVRGDESVAGRPLAELIHELDWAATPVGPEEAWPQSLRTALSICLESRFPILIWWGPDFVMLYNDAYAPLIGSKHPRALGQPGAECFPEIWEIIGPMLAGVRDRGEATWSTDQLLELDRRGFPEECYFTFSYSPIRDESGGVGGVFTAVSETTEHVIGERRLRVLRELSAATRVARTPAEACRLAAGVLEGSVSVPFSLACLFDPDEAAVRLVATSGLDAAAADGAFARVTAAVEELAPWRAGDAPAPERARLLQGVATQGGEGGRALLVPLTHAGGDPLGAVVLGCNERRPLDDDYTAFLTLVAGQIAVTIADAQAYEAERRRADALAELDRAKTLFFENVSHELRTPLTLILSPLEDLLSDLGRPPTGELRDRLELMRRNALRLLRLVNTLLDFSRAESSRIDALFQPTDLAAVTADLAHAFRPAIERAGLELVVDCPPLEEPVWVDREAWEKIVLNLLSNALKYTFAGRIEVALRAEGDAVELRVGDTGVGIPEAELPRLFERFHRIRDVRARTHEGSGIGLALVQELATLHGAAVSVESESGAGSTFAVRLRRGSAHLPADRVGGAEGTAARSLGAAPYVEEALRWLPEGGPADEGEQPEAVGLRDDLVREAGVPRAGEARILIADDNADMRGYLARLLRRYWRVETVTDGLEALAAVRRSRPDLVLSDVMMPGLDGFGLLQALRKDPALRSLPVVLVSARAGAESAIEGLEAGADDYLVKPFSTRELIARVRANLELSQLRVTLAQLEGIAEERARAERILETLPEGVLTVTGDGTVDLWNPAAEAITGLPPEAVLGRPVAEALPGWGELAARLEARGGRSTTHPFELGGRELWLAVVASPHAEGTLYAFRDATEGALLEQMRHDLVTTVSHELRTPVSSIYGATATLARRDLPGEERAALIEMLHAETERLARVLDGLLAVSALDTGGGQPARRACDPRELVERALERARPRCPAAIELRATLPETGEPVLVDEQKLEQVLDTLLDNAIRYSPDGGEIEVTLEQAPGRIAVAVRDTGIGIAPRHHPHIGERFYRADPELHAGVSGLGLGLHVCRQLVALMDGRLWFESAEGAGSTFHVEVPAGRSG